MANIGSVSVANVTEGGSVSINITVTAYDISTWNYRIYRVTGDGPEGFFPSFGTFNPASFTNPIVVTFTDDSSSEVQYQGEEFRVEVRTGSTVGSGTLVAQTNFLVFDNDVGVTSVGNLSVGAGASTHSPSISYGFSDAGGVAYVEYRIVKTSPYGGVIYTGSGVNGLAPQSGTVTPTVSDVPAPGSTATYRVDVYNGNTYLSGPSYTVTRAALVAPVISSVTDDNASSSVVTTTVNLSSAGLGGTLQYAKTNSNTAPAYNDAGWQTSNVFSQSRDTNFFYWAQRVDGTTRAISASVAKYIGFLSPDTSINNIPNFTINTTATSFTVTIVGGGSTTEYQIRDVNGPITGATRIGDGVISVADAPSVGASKSYDVYARLPTASGGNNIYVYANESFTVTRDSAPVIGSVTDDAAASSVVTTTVNLSVSGSGGTLQYAKTNSNTAPSIFDSGWQTSNVFSQSRDTNFFYWAQRVDGSTRVIAASFAKYVGFLSPDTSITDITNFSISTISTSFTVTISNGGSTTEYQIRDSSGPISGATRIGDGVITVADAPDPGSSKSYDVYARLPTASGGNNVYVYANDSFTVTRDAAPAIGSVTDDNAAAPSVTATVNLSVSGSGGTLQYAKTNSNTAPSIFDSGWQTSNVFTHGRDINYFYWAQRISGSTRVISTSFAKYVGFLSPDTSIANIENVYIAYDESTFTVNIADGGATTEYQIRDDITTHESRTGNGPITVTDSPPVGGTKAYTVFARLPTAVGGNNTYTATNEFWSVFKGVSSGGGTEEEETGGTNTTNNKRVVLGKATVGSSTEYGLWVSKQGVDVIDTSGVLTDDENLIFDSTKSEAGLILDSGSATVSYTSLPAVSSWINFPQTYSFEPIVLVSRDAGSNAFRPAPETEFQISGSLAGGGTILFYNRSTISLRIYVEVQTSRFRIHIDTSEGNNTSARPLNFGSPQTFKYLVLNIGGATSS